MTTIATDGKTIAFDSQGTRGNIKVNVSVDKHREADGYHFFFCGSTKWISTFIDCYFSEERAKRWDNTSAFIVTPNKELQYAMFDEEGDVAPSFNSEGEIYAVGSGMEFAMAAMDLGKTPKEAVEYAATRDVYTGGQIRVFNIETMEIEE